MDGLKMRRPTPALVIAMIALFVALGGTAGAVVTAAVPLAKRALVADNAKKVGGVTAAQLGGAAAAAGAKAALAESPAGPRPSSTAAGLVTIKSAPTSVGANGANTFSVACDSGQKVSGGGYASGGGLVAMLGSAPTSDGSGWTVFVGDLTGSGSSGSVYAVCIK